jgi:PAS domain S-box-containing protein
VREMPYGYLTKPFKSRELKASLSVALHKAQLDTEERAEHRQLAATMSSVPAGLIAVLPDGAVRFMNRAAETLTGIASDQARSIHLNEVVQLNDGIGRPVGDLIPPKDANKVEEFGWTLKRPGGETLLVDLSIASMTDGAGQAAGYVITLRDAAERLRFTALEEMLEQGNCFDTAPMGMVQLDAEGHIVRVNKALERESGIAAENLVGRSLTGLSMDPDPRIGKQLMPKLLRGNTVVASTPVEATN